VVQPKGILNPGAPPVRPRVRSGTRSLDFIGTSISWGSRARALLSIKSGTTRHRSLRQRLAAMRSPDRSPTRIRSVQGTTGSGCSIPLDIAAILKIHSARYPFLLIYRILSLEENRVRGDQTSPSHTILFSSDSFPGLRSCPPCSSSRAMAQWVWSPSPELVVPTEEKRVYFIGIDRSKFRKPVRPGDQLHSSSRSFA